MRNRFGAVFSALVVLAVTGPLAAAESLFADDFEDMTANRWHVGGDGTVEVSSFAGSQALKLTKHGYALAAVRIDGQFTVEIEVGLAAESLEPGDACVAEASADGGAVWMDVLRLGDNDDDNGVLEVGSAKLTLPGPMSTLVIQLRAEGDSNSDICWADEVRVTVDQTESP